MKRAHQEPREFSLVVFSLILRRPTRPPSPKIHTVLRHRDHRSLPPHPKSTQPSATGITDRPEEGGFTTRPTLDEMYYDSMKARPTRNPPSVRVSFDTIMQLNQ